MGHGLNGIKLLYHIDCVFDIKSNGMHDNRSHFYGENDGMDANVCQ